MLISRLLVGWLAWLGIGRLAGMVGHGERLGKLLDGKSEHYVKTEHTVRAQSEYSAVILSIGPEEDIIIWLCREPAKS